MTTSGTHSEPNATPTEPHDDRRGAGVSSLRDELVAILNGPVCANQCDNCDRNQAAVAALMPRIERAIAEARDQALEGFCSCYGLGDCSASCGIPAHRHGWRP